MPACVVDPVQSPLPGLVARTRKSPPAGERADLASELTRSIDCDKGLNGAKRAHNLELAWDHNKERYGAISLL